VGGMTSNPYTEPRGLYGRETDPRIAAARRRFDRYQGGRFLAAWRDTDPMHEGDVIIVWGDDYRYRVYALDIDAEIEAAAAPRPTYDELAVENAKLRSVLARVRADRPSAHSDDVWAAINNALGGES
jgi:hypothetical protein